MTKEKENKVIELVGDLLGEVFMKDINLTDKAKKTLDNLADTLGMQ
jgi:hypothetical protein